MVPCVRFGRVTHQLCYLVVCQLVCETQTQQLAVWFWYLLYAGLYDVYDVVVELFWSGVVTPLHQPFNLWSGNMGLELCVT